MKKWGKRAQEKLGPEATVQRIAVGYAGPHPVILVACLLGGAVALAIVVALLTGTLFFPGLIPALIARQVVAKPRIVAATDRGLAVFEQSFWTAKPTKVTAKVAYPDQGGWERNGRYVRFNVGHEKLWANSQHLLGAASSSTAS